jgi:hypothetical protein
MVQNVAARDEKAAKLKCDQANMERNKVCHVGKTTTSSAQCCQTDQAIIVSLLPCAPHCLLSLLLLETYTLWNPCFGVPPYQPHLAGHLQKIPSLSPMN